MGGFGALIISGREIVTRELQAQHNRGIASTPATTQIASKDQGKQSKQAIIEAWGMTPEERDRIGWDGRRAGLKREDYVCFDGARLNGISFYPPRNFLLPSSTLVPAQAATLWRGWRMRGLSGREIGTRRAGELGVAKGAHTSSDKKPADGRRSCAPRWTQTSTTVGAMGEAGMSSPACRKRPPFNPLPHPLKSPNGSSNFALPWTNKKKISFFWPSRGEECLQLSLRPLPFSSKANLQSGE